MRFVIHVKIMDNADVAEWASNNVYDEYQGNQEAEYLISKSSA
jgi:hypothetical protein